MEKQTKLTIEIVTRRERVEPYSRKTYRWTAIFGQISGTGTTEKEAKEQLRAILGYQAANTTPAMARGPSGAVVLAFASGHPGDVCMTSLRPEQPQPTGSCTESRRGRTLLECAQDYAAAVG